MLVLTGTINKKTKGFRSVICTAVATKSKQKAALLSLPD